VFGLGLATKIYVAVEAVDMRKGFEGLYGLVRDQLGADPLSGHLFLFSNRTRTRLKALVWDLCEVPRYVEWERCDGTTVGSCVTLHST
jgi:transposase